jgi:TonB family protein
MKGFGRDCVYAPSNPMTNVPRRLSLSAFLFSGVFFVAQASSAEQSRQNGDVPLKVHRTTSIQYPPEMERNGITHGEAQIVLAVSAEGKIVDTLVAAYTHERFAKAALQAIRNWRFEAPLVHGETANTVVDIQVRFETNKVVVVERIGVPAIQQSDAPDGFAYKPQNLKVLDAIPTPVHVVQPVFPKEWSDQGMHGKVTVDFFIDETGTVRMPSVLTSPEYPLLAASAITAVHEWRFAPPLRQGRPVLAHCQQVLTFEAEPTPDKK